VEVGYAKDSFFGMALKCKFFLSHHFLHRFFNFWGDGTQTELKIIVQESIFRVTQAEQESTSKQAELTHMHSGPEGQRRQPLFVTWYVLKHTTGARPSKVRSSESRHILSSDEPLG